MLPKWTISQAYSLLTRSEELLVAIRINKTESVKAILQWAAGEGLLQALCASLEDREVWLDTARDDPKYELLLNIGLEKRVPLVEAIELSRERALVLMLEAGLDVNTRPKRHQKTALEACIHSGRNDLMRMLLKEYHADPNIRNRLWQTPIYTALTARNEEAARHLLAHGANVCNIDSFGQTPLVCFLGDSRLCPSDRDLLELLLQYAEVNQTEELISTPRNPSVSSSSSSPSSSSSSRPSSSFVPSSLRPPLHVILSNSHASGPVQAMVVEMLLERRADPDVRGDRKRTPLHVVCAGDGGSGNGSGDDDNDKGSSMKPHCRCIIVSLLLKYGADPNLQDEQFNTPLHAAARAGLAKVAELLAENGAKPTLRNLHGMRPVDLAPKESGVEMVLQEALDRWKDQEAAEGKLHDGGGGGGAGGGGASSGRNTPVLTRRETTVLNRSRETTSTTTFGDISGSLQQAANRLHASINRLEDALTCLKKQPLGPGGGGGDSSPLDGLDEVDGPMLATGTVIPQHPPGLTSVTQETIELIQQEFHKVKCTALSFHSDYNKIRQQLTLHQNCQADLDLSLPPAGGAGGGGVGGVGGVGRVEEQEDYTSERDRVVYKACHVASAMLGHEWKSLLRELECDDLIQTEVIIRELEIKHPGQLREQGYQALLHWKSRRGAQATYSKLLAATHSCSLGALRARLEETCGLPEQEGEEERIPKLYTASDIVHM